MAEKKRVHSIDDLIFIGAGPIGLFGAFYAGLRGVKTKLIESLPQMGGQLTALYPEKFIYDVPGFVGVQAKVLAQNLIDQAQRFEPAICTGEQVTNVQRHDGIWQIETDRAIHRCKAVILTIGIGAFEPKRLGDPAIDAYEGKGVHYFVPSAAAFKGQNVMVVGGGDSAVDWALMLEPVAKSVLLIHRRDQFRAHESSVAQLTASGVKVQTPYELVRLEGESRVERAVIVNNKSKEEQALPMDAVVFGLGFRSNLGPLADWGLELADGEVKVNSFKMDTNLPGVYAAGDVATYAGKIKLIATGFGEVAMAVNHACHYINPDARVDPGHSSNRTELETAGNRK
ncbi:MAG TPA: NAD(P)/FAD-dependent oxidoreductase [Limnochordia bacterium]|nr:NAD(P)/FAD-dependent oxidoreductase [Limnochordia bacterium]